MSATIGIIDAHKTMALSFGANIPLMFKGASGIGKTELSLAYAEAQGPDYGLFELNCALASLPDVIGFMITDVEKYTTPTGEDQSIVAAQFAYPYFMRDKRSGLPAFMFSRGLIVLEEYGQAAPDVKRALASIIWEKRAGAHKFPAACDVLILSNRPEDRSGVTKDFDFLINRRNEVTLAADLQGWLVWAYDHDVSNMAMAFAHRNEDKVFHNKAPEKQGPWLTPRSLVSGDNFIKQALKSGLGLDHPLVRINLGGLIGEGNAAVFIAFARLKDGLPTIEAIVANPTGTPLPPDMDQQMFLVFDMASKATKENVAALTTYLARLPSDFAVTFWRASCFKNPEMKSTKQFGDYAVKNIDLLTAVAQV